MGKGTMIYENDKVTSFAFFFFFLFVVTFKGQINMLDFNY